MTDPLSVLGTFPMTVVLDHLDDVSLSRLSRVDRAYRSICLPVLAERYKYDGGTVCWFGTLDELAWSSLGTLDELATDSVIACKYRVIGRHLCIDYKVDNDFVLTRLLPTGSNNKIAIYDGLLGTGRLWTALRSDGRVLNSVERARQDIRSGPWCRFPVRA